jgi:hypothetical protein
VNDDEMSARPPGLPAYGLTARGSVVELITLAPRDWDARGIRLVTGLIPEGWKEWYPVEAGDRERILAAREAARQNARAAAPTKPRRPPLRVRRPR